MEHDKSILASFSEDFAAIIEKHCPYVIVSGFLAISAGRSRGTEDIDMILEPITLPQFEQLYSDLSKDFALLDLDEHTKIMASQKDLKDARHLRAVYEGVLLVFAVTLWFN